MRRDNRQPELIPATPPFQTIECRGPELFGVLATLRQEEAQVLAVNITCQNHYELTVRRNSSSAMTPRGEPRKERHG